MSGRHFLGARSANIIFVFVLLTLIGLANLYSAGAETTYFAVQLRHTVIGFLCFVVTGWFVSPRLMNTYAYLFFGAICIGLVVVLILGHTAGGAQRWIRLGSFRFQPSEMAKLAVAFAVAKFFYHNRLPQYFLRDIWPILAVCLATFVLIFKQPDFGTAGICLLIALTQFAFVRVKVGFRAILAAGIGACITALVGWSFLLRPYQKQRILTLLNPGMDPSGSGYNSLQSLVAIGSGKVFGKGFMQGTQTQLQFLPARHTDFIFSVFAEEHGFWGCMFIFLLFAALIYQCLEISRESKDVFNALLGIGIAGLLTIEFSLNVAMVLGMFPVVGMPLPFFSYGGSAMLTVCLSVGILIAIDRDNARKSSQSIL
ncbi:MAG: rod shape-determining protein RodA [Zetaproteobacteria bacterium]|nr:rod shape-determining protein RodA [Zetaproteobacteria bacterium]